MPEPEPASGPLRHRLFNVVFHSEDRAGRAFDVVLIAAIVGSVAVVMLDSVASIQAQFLGGFIVAEWFFTLLFTVEYLLRLWVVRRASSYAFSFFGVVDVLSILPTYISLVVPGAQVLLSVRILRVLRIFRVLKLANYLDEANTLGRALAASRRKILIFIFVVLTLVTVVGSMMYLVESEANDDFSSIPQSVYWAIVTVSTVGFGDIFPVTPLGKALASVLIVMGYGIIAVPTGIVTVELSRGREAHRHERCPTCDLDDHVADANYCRRCGTHLLKGPDEQAPNEGASQAAPPAERASPTPAR